MSTEKWKQPEDATDLIKEADAKLERAEAAERRKRESAPKTEQLSSLEKPLKGQASEADAAILGLKREDIDHKIEGKRGIEYVLKNGDKVSLPKDERQLRLEKQAERLNLPPGIDEGNISLALVEEKMKMDKEKKRDDTARLRNMGILKHGEREVSDGALLSALRIESEMKAQDALIEEIRLDEAKRTGMPLNTPLEGLAERLPGERKPIKVTDIEKKEVKIIKPSIWKRIFGGGR